MLAWIRQLYRVERDAKELDAGARHALRQEQARPVLAKIEDWLGGEQTRALPKSPIGEAIA